MKKAEDTTRQQRLQLILDRLAERGRRITPQRLAILRMLTESEKHPSAEQLHQAILKDFPTTSLATVYKTLHLLKEEGQPVVHRFDLVTEGLLHFFADDLDGMVPVAEFPCKGPDFIEPDLERLTLR